MEKKSSWHFHNLHIAVADLTYIGGTWLRIIKEDGNRQFRGSPGEGIGLHDRHHLSGVLIITLTDLPT